MKMSAADLRKFKKSLLKKRQEITGDVSNMETRALGSTGQDSSVDHLADFGTDNFEHSLTLGFIENNEKLVKEIDDALARLELGAYGTCMHCSCQISRPRLNAIPWAAFCIECQKLAEERGIDDLENNEG